MNPQKCEEEVKYKVKFNNLKDYKENEYKSYLRFEVNGELIGEELVLKNVIKKKENPNDEINQYMEKFTEFRQSFNLDQNDYSNEMLLDKLKENNFNFELSFQSLFN